MIFRKVSRENTDEKAEPRIIVEKMIGNGSWINDYKIYCFKGEPKIMLLVQDRGPKEKRTFVNIENWDILPIKRKKAKINPNVKKPEKLDEMISVARILSKDFPFVRIDFYQAEDKIYVGEMTFSPGLFLSINPPEWDMKLGNLLDLRDIINKGECK